MPAKKKPAAPASLTSVELFRNWLAGRILGRIESDPSVTKETGGLAFPEMAWLVYGVLAKEGAETLSAELARVHKILFGDLSQLGWLLPRFMAHGKEPPGTEVFLQALDEALPHLLRGPSSLTGIRAVESNDSELVLTAAFEAMGMPRHLGYFMRKFYELCPEEEATDARGEGFFASVMERACEAVELLEELQEQYPKAAAWVARYRDRWPVLCRRGEGNPAFRKLAERIELGVEYPLDPEAKVHKARRNSLRAFLTPLVLWLLPLNSVAEEMSEETRREAAMDSLRRRGHPWNFPLGPQPVAVAAVLAQGLGQPPLRKNTARLWAEKLVVPFIMATDAADLANLKHPALLALWQQKRVKSPKTFQSRLLDAVRKELPRMARK